MSLSSIRRAALALALSLAGAVGVAGCVGPYHEACARSAWPEDCNRRLDFINKRADLDQRTRRAVMDGQLYVGMPAEAARAAWGQPAQVVSSSRSEEWQYGTYSRSGRSFYLRSLIYLHDGKVRDWQIRS